MHFWLAGSREVESQVGIEVLALVDFETADIDCYVFINWGWKIVYYKVSHCPIANSIRILQCEEYLNS